MTVPRQAVPSDARAGTYLDPSLSVDGRVGDLMARMTLEEKIAQLGSLWSFELLDGGRLDQEAARQRLSQGMGQVTRVAGATNLLPHQVAELGNQIQRFLVDDTRLGIPAILHEECLHGVMARGATCFPQSIGQAATWDPGLVERVARAISRQLRALGISQALAPILDITRDPRWGRLEETYGEDPYLVAALGCAYVRGIQDAPDGARPVIATGKHMVGHGLPEGGLNQAPAHIGRRELLDSFLFPFEAAVRDAGLRSMMHAYDDVDGVPCVASRELLTTILRDRWGFDGMVVSDYMGIDHLLTLHRMVDDLSAAAAMTLEAGLDVELPFTSAYGAPLRDAVEDGRIAVTLVDQAVGRVLRTKVELGLFERPYVVAELARPRSDVAQDEALALEVARSSIVLLKNDGVLPLRSDIRTIAVIGPNADDTRNLIGDYAHVVHIETLLARRSREGVAGPATPFDLEVLDEMAGWSTVLDAIRARASAATEVRHAPGCGITGGDDVAIAAAIETARGADVAILALGERSGLTLDATSGESRDSLDIGLPGRQSELLAAVAETGTPVVLVIVGGRPLAIQVEAERSAAVLHAWVPGEAGPAAIAQVLFGDLSPGGKLPVTVPRHVGQVPIYYGHKPSGGRSQWYGDYVDGSNLPLWPFGFGLSYSRFDVSGLRLDRESVATDGEVVIRVDVRNVGDRAADEVVQLYVRDVLASVTRPVKELRGFSRVHLDAGERCTIEFLLGAEQLAFTGVEGISIVEPGRHVVMVGTSSEDLPCKVELELTGTVRQLTARTRYLTQVSHV